MIFNRESTATAMAPLVGIDNFWPVNLSLNSASSTYACCNSFPSHVRCKSSRENSIHVRASTVSDKVLADIQNSGVIACLRAKSAEKAIEAARAALRGGISCLEITISTPGVFEVLQCLVKEYPLASLGVGTVLYRVDAKYAIKSGAKFLMSPVMVKEILDDIREFQALYIPGAMTPTEILNASKAGAKIVKVYPVSALGGVCYIRAVKKPFSHIPMVASQGITIDSIGQFIAHGATSVVLSDAIFEKKAMDDQDFDRINQLASFAALQGNEAVRKNNENLS